MIKKFWNWLKSKPVPNDPAHAYFPETGAIVDTKTDTMTEDYCYPCATEPEPAPKPKRKYTKKPKPLELVYDATTQEVRDAKPAEVKELSTYTTKPPKKVSKPKEKPAEQPKIEYNKKTPKKPKGK